MKIEDLVESKPSPSRRRPSQQSQRNQQCSLNQVDPLPSEDFQPSSQPSIATNYPVLSLPIPSNGRTLKGYHSLNDPPYSGRPEQQNQSLHDWNRSALPPHLSPNVQYPGQQEPSDQDSRHSLDRAGALEDSATAIPDKKKGRKKWESDEDKRIIQFRGDGMSWAKISRHIPGRTEMACRMHYQNYLEKRSRGNEKERDKFARVYER